MESIEESINPTKPLEVSFEYMNQLSDYIIAGSSIAIQETVGQGLYDYNYASLMLSNHCLGEFGIVYRGVMTTEKRVPKAVTVKTLKGTTIYTCKHSLFYRFLW